MIYNDLNNKDTPKENISIWRVFRIIIIYAIITIIVSIQIYRLGDGFRYWWQNKRLKKQYIQEIASLEQKQAEMKRELDSLKYGVFENERLAREIGYVKPGEIVFRFKSKLE